MTEKNNLHSLPSPWKERSHGIWLGSTLTMYRNFANFAYPPKLDPARQEQVISLCFGGLSKCDELKNPKLYTAKELGPLDKEFLFEHFLRADGFAQAHGKEGFITDDTGQFFAVINVEDHLQLEVVDTSQDIEGVWARLVKIEDCVGRSLEYAYNPRFGFLTANPAQSGTGLVIRLILHMPAVIHTGELAEVIELESEEEIVATGIQGSAQEMIGDLVVMGNVCTTGVNEEYLLTSLRMWATRAIVAEITARKKLMQTSDEQIKNKVGRALGLLTHSYQLETIEALNAISLVKLGVDLGWITSKEELNFNEIVLTCRRAHLIHTLSEDVDVPELPKKRAEFLQKIAAGLTLVI